MAKFNQMLMLKLTIMVIVTSSMCRMCKGELSDTCTNVLIGLAPCLNYITGNSSTPAPSCCTKLANVVSTNPECLCQVVSGSASDLAAGLNINRTLAFGLPSACNVQTPPISSCNAQSPSMTPEGAPSHTGSKTTPTTQGDSSGANKVIWAIPMALFLVVSQALAFNIM